MRFLLAFLFVAHGIAHLPGFLVLWRLKDLPELPYKTTLLAGHWDVGDLGARVTGSLFLLAALAFLVAAVVLVRKAPFGKDLAVGVTLFSLALTGMAWPEARVGFALDLVLLGLLWTFR